MAAVFDTTDEGLVRTTGLIAATVDYYTATWWAYLPAVPGTGVTRTLYFLANSANRAGQSIAVTQDDTGTVRLVVAGTPSAGVVVGVGWHSLAVGRRKPATFVELYVDTNVQASTATVDFSGWTFDELYLGVDPRITGAAQVVAYFREWPAFLGTYTTEWQSPVPVRTADLDTDTPLATDLLDLTAHDHDWTHVGGGTQTFTAAPISTQGAMGGWWAFHSTLIPINPPTCILKAEVVGGSAPGLLCAVRVLPGEAIWVDGVLVSSSYSVTLTYGTGPATLSVTDPIPQAAGQSVDAARASYVPAYRYALVWRCSTWDPDTGSFAADGSVALWLNDTPLLSAAPITLPRRPDGLAIRYTVGMLSDCDRMWARTLATVPATTSGGAFTGGTPSALVYHEDFESGAYAADWAVADLFSGGGGAGLAPLSHGSAGGDAGWGLSTWGVAPEAWAGAPYAPYTGLTRLVRFPPIPFGGGDPGPGPDPEEPPGPEPPLVTPSYHLDARYIRRLRRAPHIANENSRVFYRRFELDLERGTGLATGQGSDPYVLLRISRDGGQTWGEEIRMAAGHLGDYTTRVLARRLGHARDTVFEVVVSDPIAWSLVGAWLDLEPGTN